MTTPAHAGHDNPNLPGKGTPCYDVWIAAIEVATDAPVTHGDTTAKAQIYWPRIEALREALTAAGIDWRAVKAAQR